MIKNKQELSEAIEKIDRLINGVNALHDELADKNKEIKSLKARIYRLVHEKITSTSLK